MTRYSQIHSKFRTSHTFFSSGRSMFLQFRTIHIQWLKIFYALVDDLNLRSMLEFTIWHLSTVLTFSTIIICQQLVCNAFINYNVLNTWVFKAYSTYMYESNPHFFSPSLLSTWSMESLPVTRSISALGSSLQFHHKKIYEKILRVKL